MTTSDVEVVPIDSARSIGRPDDENEETHGRLDAARGRAVAQGMVEDMLMKLRRRAASHQLDRGLSLNLPYFDDAVEEIRWRTIEVIPRGRVPFVAGFLLLAVEREEIRVRSDRRLTESTRAHLLSLLQAIHAGFRGPAAR